MLLWRERKERCKTFWVVYFCVSLIHSICHLYFKHEEKSSFGDRRVKTALPWLVLCAGWSMCVYIWEPSRTGRHLKEEEMEITCSFGDCWPQAVEWLNPGCEFPEHQTHQTQMSEQNNFQSQTSSIWINHSIRDFC